MAITPWLHYADHPVAPTCRSPTGSNMPVGDTVPFFVRGHRRWSRKRLPTRWSSVRGTPSAPGMEPISPKTKFRHPAPSGNSLYQDVVFSVPTSLDLNHATLQIHYYNYQKEISLSVLSAGHHQRQ